MSRDDPKEISLQSTEHSSPGEPPVAAGEAVGLQATEHSSPGEPGAAAGEAVGLQATEHSSPGEPGAVGREAPPQGIGDPTMPPVSPAERVVAQSSPSDLSPGTMIGEFKVVEKLGAGGMGAVYMGIHPIIGKRVAIKVLLPRSATDPEVINRFILEARAVNKIGSRYIVDIFSFGVLPDGRNFFVMELLEGHSLRDILRSRGRLGLAEVRSIITCVARGLLAAHAKGIIHRDIKPENIMVLRDEDQPWRAKILDFGIAKLQDASDQLPGFSTRTGMAMGTPFYMSPEQCRGVGVDHRTDIYALGVMVFEVLTGRQPFFAESYIDLVNQHLYSPPPPPSSYLPGLPSAVDDFIVKCLAKTPEERFQTMDELLQRFTRVITSLEQESTAPDVSRPDGGQASGEEQDFSSVPVLPEAVVADSRPMRRWVFVGLGLLLCLLLLGAGWALLGRGGKTNQGGSEVLEAPSAAPQDAAASSGDLAHPEDLGRSPSGIDGGAQQGSGEAKTQEARGSKRLHKKRHGKKRHHKKHRDKRGRPGKKHKGPGSRGEGAPRRHQPQTDRDTTLNPF